MLRPALSLLTLLGMALLLPLACKPIAPANYPDRASVEQARGNWCTMVDKHRGRGLASYQKDCEGFYPAASGPFLKKMIGCYGKMLDEYGDDAPDSQTMIDSCTQEVLGGADPGDVSGSELVKARCDRMNRCQQVGVDTCKGIYGQMDGMNRALLTSMYNLRAQAAIASCINDQACGDDEDRIVAQCYRKVRDKLVWLPIHLGPDPGLSPDPS